jgi:hypothetical protein
MLRRRLAQGGGRWNVAVAVAVNDQVNDHVDVYDMWTSHWIPPIRDRAGEGFVTVRVRQAGETNMYSYFSDLHVDLLSQALLQPGEQRLGQTVVRFIPWWGFGFINKTFLVLATDQRLIVLDHRMAFFHQAMRLHAVDSLPRASVQEARVTGLFKKKLRVRGQGLAGPVAFKAVIPNALFGLLAPMRNNMAGARAVAAAFAGPSLSAPQPAFAALPGGAPASPVQPQAQYAQQPYAQQQYAQQPQQYAQQPQYAPPSLPPQPAAPPADAYAYAQAHTPSQPSIPPQNAPGYYSAPPPPVAPQSPNAAFFSPPSHNPTPPPVPRRSAPPLPPPRAPLPRN